MSKTSSGGFAHLGLVIAIVAVVAAVALGGWFVWQRNSRDETPAGTTNQPNNNAEDENAQDNVDEANPSQGEKYLVITEWGVRFALPEELRGDVAYGISTADSNGQQSANIEIGEISRLPGSNCKLTPVTDPGASGTAGGVVSIHRYADQLPSEEASRYHSEVHVGNYWYYVAPMRDACFAASDSDFVRLVGDIEDLANATRDLQQF